MTLPAFAAERRRLQHGTYSCRCRRSAANPPAAVAVVDRRERRTDGQTDGRTPYRYILCMYVCMYVYMHTMRATCQ